MRVSPFDSNARRQTSFASLEVMPELDNNIQVDIRPEDIEMQVYRSSGAGGQHINKTSSAVRLIHKPTGIVVSCQTQRSQFQNRDYAMQMLKAKLYQIAKQQHMDKIEDIKGVQNEIAWGHQIRSYVFMPYTMVKDHRTGFETSNVNAVMDGDLDGFIFAYLKAASRGRAGRDLIHWVPGQLWPHSRYTWRAARFCILVGVWAAPEYPCAPVLPSIVSLCLSFEAGGFFCFAPGGGKHAEALPASRRSSLCQIPPEGGMPRSGRGDSDKRVVGGFRANPENRVKSPPHCTAVV